jgi:hypothetical protein
MYTSLVLLATFVSNEFAQACIPGPVALLNPDFQSNVFGWFQLSTTGVSFTSTGGRGRIVIPSHQVVVLDYRSLRQEQRWPISQGGAEVGRRSLQLRAPVDSMVSLGALIQFDEATLVSDLSTCILKTAYSSVEKVFSLDPN